MIETYAATLDSFEFGMLRTVKAAVLLIIHANVDLWKKKSFRGKFFGQTMLAVYCVNISLRHVCASSQPSLTPQIYIQNDSGVEQRRVN